MGLEEARPCRVDYDAGRGRKDHVVGAVVQREFGVASVCQQGRLRVRKREAE